MQIAKSNFALCTSVYSMNCCSSTTVALRSSVPSLMVIGKTCTRLTHSYKNCLLPLLQSRGNFNSFAATIAINENWSFVHLHVFLLMQKVQQCRLPCHGKQCLTFTHWAVCSCDNVQFSPAAWGNQRFTLQITGTVHGKLTHPTPVVFSVSRLEAQPVR